MARSRSLFDDDLLPEGFRIQENFLQPSEEAELIQRFAELDFHELRMRGVAARRRILQYGWRYSFEAVRLSEGEALPDFLLPVRDRAAAFAGMASSMLSEALLTEYSPGAPIGWHRDAPPFGDVVGISLRAACRFRFRRGRPGAWETTELPLRARSIYVLTGPARSEWEHSIPAVTELRYSITFRTLRTGRADAPRGSSE